MSTQLILFIAILWCNHTRLYKYPTCGVVFLTAVGVRLAYVIVSLGHLVHTVTLYTKLATKALRCVLHAGVFLSLSLEDNNRCARIQRLQKASLSLDDNMCSHTVHHDSYHRYSKSVFPRVITFAVIPRLRKTVAPWLITSAVIPQL